MLISVAKSSRLTCILSQGGGISADVGAAAKEQITVYAQTSASRQSIDIHCWLIQHCQQHRGPDRSIALVVSKTQPGSFPAKSAGIPIIMRSDVKGGRHVHVNVMGLPAGGQLALNFCGPSSPVGPSSSRWACCSLPHRLYSKTLVHKQVPNLSAVLPPSTGN